jgi:hypothetical protein
LTSCLRKAALFFVVISDLGFVSCGYSSSYYKPPSGLSTRVMVSQDVTSNVSFGGLFIVNAQNDTLARTSEVSAGNTPGLMALSPTRSTLLVFDPSTNSVQVINARTESNTGQIRLAGPTSSMVIPATTGTGYAAVPTASSNLFTTPGAVEVLNLSTGSTFPIGVPNAQTIVSNQTGAQLLVFSPKSSPTISDSIYLLSPLLAVGPIDQGCDDVSASSACKIIPGFDQPVFAIVNGSTAYILNCGPECGGTQASVAVFDLASMTITNTIPVNAATMAFLSGSTLYVVGTPPGTACLTGTAATTCGTLDVVDLGSMTDTNFASPILITDGYHDRMDMSLNGQLFIGSHNCTEIGNVNNPQGEVRGCLSIFDTTKAGNTTAVIPPDNGDVTGLQSFSTRKVEYVVEGGILRIYDTTKDVLQFKQITLVGQIIDVKAVDFF